MNLAEKYIDDVVNGRVITGKTIKQAVARHLDDLDHADERGWYFDKKSAIIAIKAIQVMPHTLGKWANKPFQLQPWQAFVLWCFFGWKIKASRKRRFQKCYVKIPRKNGKTEFLAAIANLVLLLFGIEGGQLWWAATKKDQARIGWERQKVMIEKLQSKDKILRKRLVTNKKRIVNKKNNMFVDAIGRDSKTEDGHAVLGGFVDELHAHPTGEIVEILESGTGAFDDPMVWIITTAGFNTASYCKGFEDTCKQILSGTKENNGLFIMIFDMDEDDDWEDPKNWYKVNPGLGVSPTLSAMQQLYQNAKTDGGTALTNFLVKNLNVWRSSLATWINPDVWKKSGAGLNLSLDDLKGKPCYGGLDLAATTDITALALFFELPNDKFALYVRMWLPEETAIERTKKDSVKYTTWVDQGWINTTPGNVVDYNYIRKDVKDLAEYFDIKAINYDRWNSSQLVNDLTDDGAKMHPFGQGFASMSGPSKEFEKMALSGQIYHFKNPVLSWMLSNVQIVFSPAGDIKADKGKSSEKIDGVVAGIMAIGAWLSLREVRKKSVYENRGVRFL
ncbi:MAG: terminase large subunit [Flavobacteriaceae bacterium]